MNKRGGKLINGFEINLNHLGDRKFGSILEKNLEIAQLFVVTGGVPESWFRFLHGKLLEINLKRLNKSNARDIRQLKRQQLVLEKLYYS
jgi:hypothetical protein